VVDPSTRLQVVSGVVLVLAALLGGAWYGSRRPEPPPVSIAAAPSAEPEGAITVHVSGAVATPGLVSIPADSLVAHAIAAAGGGLAEADLGGLNLAASLRHGEHIVVPLLGEVLPPSAAGGPVDLNQASASELEALPVVGPVLAGRIVAFRETNGPFTEIEDLLDVPGIGESKLADLRDAVRVP